LVNFNPKQQISHIFADVITISLPGDPLQPAQQFYETNKKEIDDIEQKILEVSQQVTLIIPDPPDYDPLNIKFIIYIFGY